MSAPIVKLTRRDATVELADGRILTVRLINPDLLRWEDTAQRQGWDTVTVKDGVAVPVQAQQQSTFLIWAALTRTGQYHEKYQLFRDSDCVDFDVNEVDVDPTLSALEADFSRNSSGPAGDSPSTGSQPPPTS